MNKSQSLHSCITSTHYYTYPTEKIKHKSDVPGIFWHERMMPMSKFLFSTYGHSPALLHARNALQSWGYDVSPNPWEATHLLLPVPSFDEDGRVKGGGCLSALLPQLRPDVTIFGGNLDFLQGRKADFLQDEYYLLENAAITARCALKYADIRPGIPVLVIGWGRIGKHLAAILAQMRADVTVAVRKQAHFETLQKIGLRAVYLQELVPAQYAVIFNTAPAPVLDGAQCQKDAQLIDLASKKGITGDGVIWARGLPGKDAPEESGTLIAKTALRYALEGDICL